MIYQNLYLLIKALMKKRVLFSIFSIYYFFYF